MNRTGIKIFLVFALLCLIWGSTWLAIRINLNYMPPFYSSSFRFALASMLILLIMRFRHISMQTDKIAVRIYILQGFFSYAIPYALIYWSEQYVPSGLAAILFGIYPFSVAFFSYFLISDEKVDIYKVAGILLGFSGILIIFWNDIGGQFTSYLLGMIVILISGIMQAFMAVIIKKYGHHLNPLSMNFFPMLIGSVFLLAAALTVEKFSALGFNTSSLLSILYLSLFGSVITFTGYYWLMKRLNVVILSLMSFITPIVALLLGWIILSEELSGSALAGSLLVVGGLLAANVKGLITLYSVNRTKKQNSFNYIKN